LIIPRTPIPDHFERSTAAEKEELARQRYAELRIKTETTHQAPQQGAVVKREIDLTKSIETVDLLEDNDVMITDVRQSKRAKTTNCNEGQGGSP